MSKSSPSDSNGSKTTSQFNARLPQLTHNQIQNLVDVHGLTKTQVIIVAVDRLARELDAESLDTKKDIRMLKTVARIVPDIDFGQVVEKPGNQGV
ncbi:MAG: hypothetical protein PVF74_12835, partial [Anaerolineales bacterium]